MESIYRSKTDRSPSIDFQSNGELSIIGKFIINDPLVFFEKPLAFCSSLNSEKVNAHLRIDYLNTASSKCIYQMLMTLEDNPAIKTLNIHWYYEFEDSDMLEVGKDYADLLEKARFEFISVEEVVL